MASLTTSRPSCPEMVDLEEIRQTIARETGTCPEASPLPVSGGCINEAFLLGDYFVKTNSPKRAGMFEAELLGLSALQATDTIRVPRPLVSGATTNRAYLVLEQLALRPSTADSQERLGRELAGLHRCSATHFGWERDNFIGTTPQPNPRLTSWISFLREHRLGHMLHLARECGHCFQGADSLLDHLDHFFENEPPPSLLHGDLWGGNAGALRDGSPVTFDPAVYFGDREADLAMTMLFGGFTSSFHASYREAWPLSPGHENRFKLYNLYHVLNHTVLFGDSYAQQAQEMINYLVERL